MTAESSREDRSNPPASEASALLARMFSPVAPHAIVAGSGAPSTPASASTADDLLGPSDSIATTIPAGRSVVEPEKPIQTSHRAPANTPTAIASPPRSGFAVALKGGLLAVLIFGSGFAIGRFSKSGESSTASLSRAPAMRKTSPAAAVSPAIALNAPNPASANTSSTLPRSQASAEALPERAADDSLETGAVLTGNPRKEKPAHAITEENRAIGPRSVLQNSLTLSKPDVRQPVAPVGQSEIALPASNPPDLPVTTALPTAAPAASEAFSDRHTDEPNRPIAAPPDHLDPSQLLHSVQPVYPEAARTLGVEGKVALRVVVATDGTVRSVSLISGPPSLAPAAMDAAREFRYKPARLNGQPIEAIQTIEMSFRLKR